MRQVILQQLQESSLPQELIDIIAEYHAHDIAESFFDREFDFENDRQLRRVCTNKIGAPIARYECLLRAIERAVASLCVLRIGRFLPERNAVSISIMAEPGPQNLLQGIRRLQLHVPVLKIRELYDEPECASPDHLYEVTDHLASIKQYLPAIHDLKVAIQDQRWSYSEPEYLLCRDGRQQHTIETWLGELETLIINFSQVPSCKKTLCYTDHCRYDEVRESTEDAIPNSALWILREAVRSRGQPDLGVEVPDYMSLVPSTMSADRGGDAESG